MNRALRIVLCGVVSGFTGAAPAAAQNGPSTKPVYDIKATSTPDTVAELRALQKQVQMILTEITPAVVGVRIGASQGSGVIISEDGFVLTAGHVSGPPGQNCTLIMPDGKQLRGKTLGRNGAIDSGMIKITDPGPFPHVQMGKSADLKPGQWLVAIGHPGGYRRDRPPVVRLGRFLSMSGPFVATDCTLVGGDSGGPLFDLGGRVVGIHSRIGNSLTSNMHVPVDTYHTTWDRLVAGDSWGGMLDNVRVPTPYLGINGEDQEGGVRITTVSENTPAALAGMKEGDLIVKMNETAVPNIQALGELISKQKVGDEITITVVRDGENVTLKAKLAARP